jgi:murein L,D-transpeptidase YcbB/YkuD
MTGNNMTMRVIFTALLAGSMLSAPISADAAEKKRKNLFEILFKKNKLSKKKSKKTVKVVKVKKKKQVAVKKTKKKIVKQAKKLPKIESSKNYTYKVAKRAPIVLVAAPLKYALAETDSQKISDEKIEMSRFTADIVNAGKVALRAEQHLAKAISDYYKDNQSYNWINENGSLNDRALAAMSVLKTAYEYGLRVEDYKVEPFEIVSQSGDIDSKFRSREMLSREVALTTAILRYAMDARFGTINPNKLSGYHDFPVHDAKAPDVLEKVMSSSIIKHSLQAFHPSNEKFSALRRELLSLKSQEDDLIKLDPKTFIRPGQEHAELPDVIQAVRKRGSAELLEKHSEVLEEYYGYLDYDKRLVAAVKDYQKEVGLGADGIVGRNTITKLAGISSDDKARKLALSMERLRWHPNQFGERHVFINQPEYRARYIENGKEALSMRVVVGKKSNQTNFFYDEIEHVVYNPYWGVPASIIVNEFTPKSIANPAYLDQRGYELKTWGGKKLKSSNINWSKVGIRPNFSVRQKPGPKNALGSLKIMFPNKHAIYMHDTPAKALFNREHRAYSHGCVRLHDPQAMAAAVLGKSKRQVNSFIKQGKNKTEKLSVKVPVYVSYFTAWPQEDGTVKYFNDMYERDDHLMKAFKATQKARSISISS